MIEMNESRNEEQNILIIQSVKTISIIIPIYNVEAYLPECVESIINQTYQDLEIILVNDGSTDRSSQICEDYATRDSRVKVIHKENEGSAAARNAGLHIATGDLIGFVDSDDIIAVDFYKKLFKAIEQDNADIAECGFTSFKNSTEINHSVRKREPKGEPIFYGTVDALKLIMEGPLSVVVWNKIYRREVVKDLLFPAGKYIDDEYWTYKVLGNSLKIVKTSEILYYYRQQHNSLMGSSYSIRRLDGLQAHEERIFYMQEKFPGLQNLAIRVFSFGSMYHYQQISLNEELDPKRVFRNEILNKVKIHCSKFIISNWNWKDRIRIKLFMWNPDMYLKINRILEARIQKRLNNTVHD